MKKLLIGLIAALSVQAGTDSPTTDLPALRPDIVDVFRVMPIFEGRVKPLETFARLKLLRYSGYTTAKLEASGSTRTLDPTEWLMATIFYPEEVKDIPLFLVDDTRIVSRMGIAADKARDRFSFQELEPASKWIMEFLQNNRQAVEDKTITPEDQKLFDLCLNFRDYQLLLNHFDFARNSLNLNGGELPSILWKEGDKGMSTVEFLQRLEKARAAGSFSQGLTRKGEELLAATLSGVQQDGFAATSLSVIPNDPETLSKDGVTADYFTHWTSPGAIMLRSFELENRPGAGEIARLGEWSQVYAAFVKGPDELAETATALSKAREAQAATSGGTELSPPKLALEVAYNRADLFYYAGVGFAMLFLVLAASWLAPNSFFGTWARRLGSFALLIPFGMVVAAIVIRTMLLNHNPVTTLYETFAFIAAVGLLVCLVTEWRIRNGVAAGVGAFAGFVCMWLTYLFETRLDAGQDTLQNLQAVLRSNFWLRTHVTTVTIGYAGGMIAVMFSLLYVIGRVFGLVRGGSKQARALTRMTYGTVAFCLLFAIIGTILGGIWANYSWGRFWGWDPKENGALMICLWSVMILHARLGGYLKEAGIHCLTLILGAIISFSWFGVNQLSVGLHAYGFNEKLQSILNILYSVTLGGAMVASLFWLLDGWNKSRKAQSKRSEPQTA